MTHLIYAGLVCICQSTGHMIWHPEQQEILHCTWYCVSLVCPLPKGEGTYVWFLRADAQSGLGSTLAVVK